MSYRSYTRLAAAAALTLQALSSSCQRARETAANPTITLEDCHLEAPGTTLRVRGKCGTLDVWEDRRLTSGKRIGLRVAVLKAVDRDPEPDPIFILSGGPGQAATESIALLVGAFRRIRKSRDLVVVDQRGTGGSHALRCPTQPNDEFADLSDEEIRARVHACVDALPGEPRHYSSRDAATDLDEVRRALGYQSINLYGISYGTRLAMVYGTMFESNVRTMILDGVVPQEIAVGEHAAANAQRALGSIFDRCVDNTACQEAFAGLPERFDELMERLKTPIRVSLEHPRTGTTTEFWLDRRKAGLAIRLLSYSPETAAVLPLVIYEASESRYEALASQYLIASESLSESIADAMHYSIICSEDVPFYRPDAGGTDIQTFLGDTVRTELVRLCSDWPRFSLPDTWKTPFRIDRPVLLLSGESDPVTPPANAEQVAQSLRRSKHLVAPGLGHGVISRGCIPRLATEFVETASVDSVNPSCLESIEPLGFFTSYAGPTP